MENKEQVVKHLEMIQGVVNRLGHDSFLVKGWSMSILAAGVILLARGEVQSEWIVLALLVPVIGFWVLDGYFLWQERLFRAVYNDVRMEESTDFAMNVAKHRSKPKCNWVASTFSLTLVIFYVFIECLSVVGFFTFLYYGE